MPNPHNPHNSYYYKPLDQAAPIYLPPSRSTRSILPVPQKSGQGDYHYGMPGQASPVYIPPSPSAGKRMAKNQVMSDERSKSEIRRLESANDALTQALGQQSDDGQDEYMRHVAPKSGANYAKRYDGGPADRIYYPEQWDARDHGGEVVPSHASFPNAPAEKVAAQNVGLQQATPPPPPVAQGNPRPGFDVSRGTPDLSALDEAYARMGRGG